VLVISVLRLFSKGECRRHPKKPLAKAVAISLAVFLGMGQATGQDAQYKDALKEITDAANQICQSPPLEHSSDGVNLSGEAKAKLGGVVGKLADLGIAGTADYQHSESRGVLEKELATAMRAGNDCKLEVFKTLERDLLHNRRSELPLSSEGPPDVTLRFVYPASPALLLTNRSGTVARDIKWSVAVWNLDDPRTYINANPGPNAHDPLPIPVSTFDFLRPHTSGGPQNLFGGPLVATHVRDGQRLFGSASVVCPACARGHTYIVSITWGHGGWYAETSAAREGELVLPSKFSKEGVVSYYDAIISHTQETNRMPILDK
jgi:hypothetical protein